MAGSLQIRRVEVGLRAVEKIRADVSQRTHRGVERLEMGDDAFRHARKVLRDCGNMSSPSCLFVLDSLVRDEGIAPGEMGVVAALGPGFSSEYVLVRGAE